MSSQHTRDLPNETALERGELDDPSVLVICGFSLNPAKFDNHVLPISTVADTTAICYTTGSSAPGLEYRRVPTFGFQTVGLVLILAVGLYEALRRDYDLVVTYSLIPYGLIGLLMKYVSRTPVHLGIIGSDLDVHAHATYGPLVKWCFRRFDAITVAGSVYQERLREAGVPDERIFTLIHSIDLEYDSADHELDAEYDLLWLTRLAPSKDPLLFIEVLTELRDRGVEFTAAIVGDGPLEDDVREAVAERGLTDRVDLPGWTDEPMAYYRRADVYVLTSARDMLPLSLLEAMSAGLACVCPAIGGVPDVVSDGENGILVDERTPAAFAERIHRLLANDDERRRIGRRATGIREVVSHRHGGRRWAEILERTCER